MNHWFQQFDGMQLFSAFIVLAAIIDILGSIPKILELKDNKRKLSPIKATTYALALTFGFYFGGQWMLQFFGVDNASFAAAGSIIIFLTALEIILDMSIFKERTPLGGATLVPLVFPNLIGAGAFTTLLSLRAAYADVNIIIAVILNILPMYAVIRNPQPVQRILGKSGIYFSRKFFGIILLAIAVKLFTENMGMLLH